MYSLYYNETAKNFRDVSLMELLKEIVYQRLCDMIFAGDMTPGSRLPGEFELSRQMGVSRVTLRAALSRLEKEGVISRSRQLGTVVNFAAKPRPKLLVVLNPLDDLPDTPLLQMISGASARCAELGMEIDTVSYDYFTDERFLGDRYMGVIQTGCNFYGEEKLLKVLNHCGLPVVNAMAFEGDPPITGQATVLFDACNAWFDGLKYLLRFGHRRIAFLLNDIDIIERRFNCSFEQFRTVTGKYCPNDRSLFLFPETDSHISEAMSALLNSAEPPTAFYSYKVPYARLLYQFAKEHGLNIPKNFAVMSFDGGHGAALLRPSLSTVDFGYQRVGRIAVDVLMDHSRWEDAETKPVIHTPYTIFGRESTDRFITNYTDGKHHSAKLKKPKSQK